MSSRFPKGILQARVNYMETVSSFRPIALVIISARRDELMRWMPPPSGISYAMTCVDAPCLASMIIDLSAWSSIGRVSGL